MVNSKGFRLLLNSILDLVIAYAPHKEPPHSGGQGHKWNLVFDDFFQNTRGFSLDMGTKPLQRFKDHINMVIDVLASYHQSAVHGRRQRQHSVPQTNLQTKGFSIFEDRERVVPASDEDRCAAGESAARWADRLDAAENDMGLQAPGRGVTTLSLSQPLTARMVQALDILGQSTWSPHRNAARRGCNSPTHQPAYWSGTQGGSRGNQRPAQRIR